MVIVEDFNFLCSFFPFRNEKLEAEAKAGMERFEEITKRWDQASNREIPQDLHDLLMQQKGLCDAMIDEKNKLINDFQMVRTVFLFKNSSMNCNISKQEIIILMSLLSVS